MKKWRVNTPCVGCVASKLRIYQGSELQNSTEECSIYIYSAYQAVLVVVHGYVAVVCSQTAVLQT